MAGQDGRQRQGDREGAERERGATELDHGPRPRDVDRLAQHQGVEQREGERQREEDEETRAQRPTLRDERQRDERGASERAGVQG
ncbi:MAG: hypothetical protein MUF34_02365 [Polyangiaceae bacterium]|nr:hypothetical protein [Polyangiaceae bacterium]